MTSRANSPPLVTGASLRRRWRCLVARVGLSQRSPDPVLGALVSCYNEPHRRYHTLHHIADVLGHLDRLFAAGEVLEDPEAVELAAWWHDAVYEPGRGDNESRSAALATRMLAAAGLDAERVARTAALVEVTAGHHAQTADAAVLVDADLAVLGRRRTGYLRYARQIREEFREVCDPAYRRGRIAVLSELLARPQPYATATMSAERRGRLEANLCDEIRRLSDVGRPVDEVLRDAVDPRARGS